MSRVFFRFVSNIFQKSNKTSQKSFWFDQNFSKTFFIEKHFQTMCVDDDYRNVSSLREDSESNQFITKVKV